MYTNKVNLHCTTYVISLPYKEPNMHHNSFKMADDESRNDSGLPLLTHPETNIIIPLENTTAHGTDLLALDTQTSMSSLSEISSSISGTIAKHELHPCFDVLNGGRRLKLKNMAFRI